MSCQCSTSSYLPRLSSLLQEAVFAQLLELVKTNLSPEKGDAYLTSIVALGHIAFHLPDQFPVHIKNLVSRKIVKELLMVDAQEVNAVFT